MLSTLIGVAGVLIALAGLIGVVNTGFVGLGIALVLVAMILSMRKS